MASNRELTEQARTLGAQLGVQVETQGLNNSALAALVVELTAKLQSTTEAPPEQTTDPEYRMAVNCQLVTGRGVLGYQDRVYVSDLSDGQPQLDRLVAAGTVVKS